jgi:hypothetical protein
MDHKSNTEKYHIKQLPGNRSYGVQVVIFASYNSTKHSFHGFVIASGLSRLNDSFVMKNPDICQTV